MIMPNSLQKIQNLTKDILFAIDRDPAKKIIPKFYDLASTINQEMPTQNSQKAMTSRQKQTKEKLENSIKSLEDLFLKFKQTRASQIKSFNQVEYYMFEQTERILHKFESPIIKIVFDKISQIAKIFTKTQTQQLRELSPPQERHSLNSKKKITSTTHTLDSYKNIDLGPGSAKKLWKNVLEYYENHRLDDAYTELMKFEQVAKTQAKDWSYLQDQQELIDTIKLEYKTMTQFYEYFYDTGYTFDKQQKGISLWYKIIGEKDVAIRVQAEVDITIQNFLCIASEINLFEDYIPFTYGTKELKSISRNQKIGTSKIYIPLLSDRETYFYAAAYDRLRTTGSIFFFSKTINQDKEYQQKYGFQVPKASDCVRLEYKYYILEYIPLTKTRGKINMVASIDLKMDFLPLFIINKSARIFSFDYMRNYHRINKRFSGSKWQKVKNQKKELYDYFQQKIDEFLLEKQNLSQSTK